MRPQTLVVMLLALLSGVAAVLAVRSSWRKPAPVEDKVPAIFALVDLPRGTVIDEKMVEVRQVPKDNAPEGRMALLHDGPQVDGALARIVNIPMLKDEIVLERKLLPKGSRAGMASMIPPGMRAFTILTPSFSSSLAGFLQPGNSVDVLLTITPPGPRGEEGATTSTLLQNVELLAVHTTVDAPAGTKADPNDTRSVTLLVTPKQASILDLAQNRGTLHLSLRNSLDETNTGVDDAKATFADLGLPPPTPEPERAEELAGPPAPPAADPGPAPEPEPDPDEQPVVLTVRTLRGTIAGSDRITVLPGRDGRPAILAPITPPAVASPRPRPRPR